MKYFSRASRWMASMERQSPMPSMGDPMIPTDLSVFISLLASSHISWYFSKALSRLFSSIFEASRRTRGMDTPIVHVGMMESYNQLRLPPSTFRKVFKCSRRPFATNAANARDVTASLDAFMDLDGSSYPREEEEENSRCFHVGGSLNLE